MAQIYGELIRAQLQVSASDLGSPAAGLVYFNDGSSTLAKKGLNIYNGSAWKTAVDLDSSQTLANKSLDATCSINSGILPVVPLTKGGLGADASAWSGLVKISGGVASASSLALTDIPNTLITYAKLNLADGDIPQAKVSGLVTDLAGKLTGNAAITGATKTKITYDSKGLVTAGADLAAGDLPTGIDATKIADGSVDNTEFQKLGTAGTSGAGLLVTTDGLQTLSNKTLASPGVTGNMIFADTADIRFLENGGLDTVVLKGPTSVASTYTFTLPSTPGQANQVLKTDGTGITSWGAGGSGAGGINYLSDYFDATTSISSVSNIAANGNITVNGSTPLLTSAWYADATSGSSAIARSASTALRGSYNYLTALSGTSTSGSTFVQTSAFNVDSSDLGKPVTVSFDLTGVTTDDDWDIVVARYSTTGSSGTGTFVELIPVAGNVSTVTGTPGAKLPTGTTQFKGFFIASSTANDVYALRLRRRAGSAQVRLDSLFVGPQSLAQGAVVTASQQYTPSASVNQALGTLTNVDVSYARHGEFLILEGRFDLGTLTGAEARLALPSGLTVGSYTQDTRIVGTWAENNTSANNPKIGNLLASSGHNYLRFSLLGEQSTTNSPLVAINANAGLSSLNTMVVSARVKISQWSSGTTTLADRAVEEYAWNSDTTDASTTASGFSNGPSGVLIGSFTSAERVKRVRFQTPIISTDILTLEIYDGTGWLLGSNAFTYITQGAGRYGAIIAQVNSTDVDVKFSASGARPTNATYGGGGDAWAVFNNYRWRVRKVSSGAAVGFPVSARNIVGDTSGSVVPTGMIGEVVTQSITRSAQTSFTSGVARNITTNPLQLSAGVWEISANFIAESGSGDTISQASIGIGTTPATLPAGDIIGVPDSGGQIRVIWTGSVTNNMTNVCISPYRVIVSSSLTLYAVGIATHAGGAANIFGSFRAVRIA